MPAFRAAKSRVIVQVLRENMAGRYTAYLLVAVFLAAVAGVEIMHAFSTDDSSGVLACMAPQSKVEAFREMLLLHLYSH